MYCFNRSMKFEGFFKPLTVIKTFPRKGYQWVHEVTDMQDSPQPSKQVPQILQHNRAPAGKHFSLFAGLIGAACIVLVALFFFLNVAENQPKAQQVSDTHALKPPSRELVVLPVNSQVEGSDHAWVRLGAMDTLVQKLKSQRRFAVLDVEDVMLALSRSESFEITDKELQSRMLRSELGEIVSLHTTLTGAPMEYQLRYSLIGRYQIKQGVLFGEQLSTLWDDLMVDVMAHYQDDYDLQRGSIAQQVADYHFYQAMEQFHRGDHESASQYFDMYIASHPEHITAHRYLIKSLIFKKDYERANVVANNALVAAKSQQNHKEYLRILFEQGIIAVQQRDVELATARLEQSRELADKHQDKLYAAFAHTTLGRLLVEQQDLVQAKSLFEQALSYHQGFNCPYGKINNLDALSEVSFAQGNLEESQQYYEQARNIALQNTLHLEHVYLLYNFAKRHEITEKKIKLLNEALSLVVHVENPNLRKTLREKIVKALNEENRV